MYFGRGYFALSDPAGNKYRQWNVRVERMIIHTLCALFFSRIIRTDYFGISELRCRARRLLGKVSRRLLVVQQSVGHNFQSAAGREFSAESAGIRRNVRPLQGKQRKVSGGS